MTWKYIPNVGHEKVKKVLHLEGFKAIYGILQSALLSFIKLGEYLDTDGFKFNPYDPCVGNNIIEGELPTIVFPVYGVNASHKNKKLVYTFE